MLTKLKVFKPELNIDYFIIFMIMMDTSQKVNSKQLKILKYFLNLLLYIFLCSYFF